jgi:hypothetical protein
MMELSSVVGGHHSFEAGPHASLERARRHDSVRFIPLGSM